MKNPICPLCGSKTKIENRKNCYPNMTRIRCNNDFGFDTACPFVELQIQPGISFGKRRNAIIKMYEELYSNNSELAKCFEEFDEMFPNRNQKFEFKEKK